MLARHARHVEPGLQRRHQRPDHRAGRDGHRARLPVDPGHQLRGRRTSGVPATALFASWSGKHGWPYWPALVVALVVGTLSGAVVELAVIRRLFTRAARDRARRDDRRRAALRRRSPSRCPTTAPARSQTQFPLPFAGEWHPGSRHRRSREPAARPDRRAAHHHRAVVAARPHRVRRRGAGVGDQRRPRPPDRHQPEAGVDRGLGDRRVPVDRRGDPAHRDRPGLDRPRAHRARHAAARAWPPRSIGGMVSFPRAVLGGDRSSASSTGCSSSTTRARPGSCSSCSSSLVLVLVARVSRARRRPAARASRSRRASPRSPNGCASIWWVRRLPQLVAGSSRSSSRSSLPLLVRPSRRGTRRGRRSSRFAHLRGVGRRAHRWAGQLSLGQMAFAGIGALTAAALVTRACRSTSAGATRASSTAALRRDRRSRGRCCIGARRRVPRRGARRRRRAPRPRAAARGQHVRVRDRRAGLPLRPPVLHRAAARPCSSRGPTSGRSTSPHRNRAYYYFVLARARASCCSLVGHLRRTGIGRMIVGVRENEHGGRGDDRVARAREADRVRARRVRRRARRRAARRGEPSRSARRERFFLVEDSLALVAIVGDRRPRAASPARSSARSWVIGLPAFWPDNDLVPLLTSSIGLLVILLYIPGRLRADRLLRCATRCCAGSEQRLPPAPAEDDARRRRPR